MTCMEYGFASPRHAEFPPMVVASIVNICNLACIHCHYSTFASRPDYRPHMMEWEIWTKLCDEMAAHPWSILNLGTDGEPLVHKRFLDMLRYARKLRIEPINMTTNGVLLRERLARTIVEERLLDVINISLDALSEEKYRIIRGRSYQPVHRNVLRLIEIRNTLRADLKIQVNIIDQPEVADELEAFVAYWEPRVDNVLVRTYYDATHLTGRAGPDLTGKQRPFPSVERWPCQLFWRRVLVDDHGVVRFCLDDWYNQSRLGHLRTSSLREIWQGEAYAAVRAAQLEGRFQDIPICAACTEWQGMRWDYDYFTAMEKVLERKLL